MLRTFREHTVREVVPLDGRWDFVIEEECEGAAGMPGRYTRTIQVPSAWESLPGLAAYRGQGWLRRTIAAVDGKHIRLVFGGVSHTGTVYVDGCKVGSHYDAFTPFDIIVAGLSAGEHELVVKVDNSFGPHSALHIENDYYTYGGITRPVALEYVPDLYLARVHATPVRSGKAWDLAVKVLLRNLSRQPQTRDVRLMLGETVLDLGAQTVQAESSTELSAVLEGIEVSAWTAETPTLYVLRAQVLEGSQVVDDVIDRVGFREIRVDGRKLLLNGKPLRLRGFNRHEDHPQFGNALPLAAMATDLEIMRDLGCNFVRTCHYPNDMRFLDLCDEMGFYVWEESHARTVKFDHPMYREQITCSTEEMVAWHYNHPSIIIWAALNECDSVSDQGVVEHGRVLGLLKKLDRSRPVTFASNKGMDDRALGHADILSFNLYDAWYGEGPELVEPTIQNLLKWLHSDASHGGKGKPVILSEFGAGAIYGDRMGGRLSKWSEEYQVVALEEYLRVYLNHPDIVGAAIWQFCDVRITQKFWARRPRMMNNKGVVDEYRRPKLSYETVKRRFHAAIASWETDKEQQ